MDPADVSLATNGKQALDLKKRAGVADINPDALPSSVASKIVSCVDKRYKALTVMRKAYQDIPEKEHDHERSLVWSSTCASNPTFPTIRNSAPKDDEQVDLGMQESREAVLGHQP